MGERKLAEGWKPDARGFWCDGYVPRPDRFPGPRCPMRLKHPAAFFNFDQQKAVCADFAEQAGVFASEPDTKHPDGLYREGYDVTVVRNAIIGNGCSPVTIGSDGERIPSIPDQLVAIISDALKVRGECLSADWIEERARNIAQAILGEFDIRDLPLAERDPDGVES